MRERADRMSYGQALTAGCRLVVAALLLCACGCASPSMKGTPFYSGAVGARKDSADRLNLWPLAYYREGQVLSLFWPMMEKTPDHLAMRPWISVYGLRDKKRVYNVLWPWAQFDNKKGKYRFFPIFWGQDRFSVFPLYWHKGQPLGPKGGHDALIPLWAYGGDAKGHSLHVLWPFFHVKDRGLEKGWRVWPLYGDYRTAASRYRFLFWPLGHQWSRNDGRAVGSALAPLYYYGCDGDNSLRITPLYQGYREGNRRGWDFVPGLFYSRRAPDEKAMFTPLGGYSRDKEGMTWVAAPLLSGGRIEQDAQSIWMLGPLARARWDATSTTHHVFPFYYWDGRTRTVVSPLYAAWRGRNNEKNIMIPPLLSWLSLEKGRKNLWLLGGFGRLSWGEEPAAQYLAPLFYYNGKSGTFASPLVASWRLDAGGRRYALLPAFSWLSWQKDRRDLWVAWPLSHFSWGEKGHRSHVFPLYYRNRATGTIVTPLAGRWQDGKRRNWVFPPLLSGCSREGDTKRVTAALGLFHNRWGGGEDSPSGHLFPLYYYRQGKVVITPLFGWNRTGRNQYCYPFTPLAGLKLGTRRGAWLFPLFSHEHRRSSGDYHGRVLWGAYAKDGRHGRSHFLPFYAYRNRGAPETTLPENIRYADYGKRLFVFPSGWYRNELFVRPAYTGGKPGEARVSRRVKRHGFFPFWSYRRERHLEVERLDVRTYALLGFYDYKREVRPSQDADGEPSDYRRHRVLWKVWDHERQGDEVHLDALGVTYDREGADMKKFSVLWRLFRYERRDGGKKLDILFVPVLRSEAKSEAGVLRR